MMSSLFTRFGLALAWLLHFLPLPLLALLGNTTGAIFWLLGRERRGVADTNLRLCFPEMSAQERKRLVFRHFCVFGRSVIERSILWWSSKKRIYRLVRVQGREHFEQSRDKPVIYLAAHFVGLEIAGNWMTFYVDGVSVYAKQKNLYFTDFLRRKRGRFRHQILFSRQDGLRGVIKAMRAGHPFYYFADQDVGAKDTLFVPFFGVPAATITAVPRLAEMTGAKVVPAITRILPGGQGYELTFYPAWDNYPSGDPMADTRRMNAFIEERVREMPEQYFWLHKRFKTRPEGEEKLYP
ncbi:MAG: lipid A biosynthesis acyltransferase [Gallionellaceae bacterium]|jgi:KDO2-lipid IV(A) lauroyltransferase|nr:lipid A biosynthesis acyltransferase [Gallionellaceae bacterium]